MGQQWVRHHSLHGDNHDVGCCPLASLILEKNKIQIEISIIVCISLLCILVNLANCPFNLELKSRGFLQRQLCKRQLFRQTVEF